MTAVLDTTTTTTRARKEADAAAADAWDAYRTAIIQHRPERECSEAYRAWSRADDYAARLERDAKRAKAAA